MNGGGAGLGDGEGVGAGVGLGDGEAVGLGEAVGVGESVGGGAVSPIVRQAASNKADDVARQAAARMKRRFEGLSAIAAGHEPAISGSGRPAFRDRYRWLARCFLRLR